MANSNTPAGLQVLRGGGSYSFNAQGSLYVVTSGNASAFYLNVPVIMAAGGDASGVPSVALSTGTGAQRGSLQAILPVYAKPSLVGSALALETTYIPASKSQDYYVVVNDDLTTMYMIQDDGITTANLVAASANLNSSMTVTAGATTTSPSATVLLSSSFADTSTLALKLFGLVNQPGNAYGAYAKWQARINVSSIQTAGATGA